MTFREYAEQWRASAPHGPSTRNLVARTLARHVYPALGDVPMASIRPTMVQALVTDLGTRLAPTMRRLAHQYVVGVFRAAVRDRVLTASPCEGVTLPEFRKPRVEMPPLEVIDALVEHLPPRLRAVVPLVVGAGLRQGEVFGLEVGSVDFLRARMLSVRQQLVMLPPERPYLGQVKTQESERTISLAQTTLDTLAAHLAEHPAREVKISDRTDRRRPVERPARLVFALDDGEPIQRQRWSDIWRPAARAAGLPPRTGLHVRRHLYASLLIRHGESVKTVQRRLGHASATITLDTYGHLWPDADDRTREAVELALAPKINPPADSVRTEGRSS